MSDTSQVPSTIDVISKYNALVTASLSGDSIYIRAKETIQELVSDGDLDETQKAAVITSLLGNAVTSITNASMSAALDWSKYETEVALKKLEMDLQLSILAQEKELKTSQVAQVELQNRLYKVESKRMYGTGTFDSEGVLTNLTGTGKVWQDMQLVIKQVSNAASEGLLVDSKLEESKVAIHKVVADTYRNFGNFTFAYDGSGNGISSVTRIDTPGSTLSDTQQEIAKEQGKGYTYNAWANALTGSASMVGTALASGDFNMGTGTPGRDLLDTVIKCASNLSIASSASDTAVPA